MKDSLLEQLKLYHQSDAYPFHMPGHKRNPAVDYIPVDIDITEIEGFDNLHHAEGVIQKAQERAARLYGSEESFFLVNGSTAGILAAVSAAVPAGKKLLLARNCHKSAYHAAFLRNLQVTYMYPDIITPYGICGGITPDKVLQELRKQPDIQAVFLTSPTYEGMVSNIEKIADIVHRSGRILIVDEAHGAHFGIAGEGFPEGAVTKGADIVIQSLHKTLPSMTQTAILHVQGERVDRRRLRRYLQIYQTSSPSYVFMAGMDSCIRLLEEKGQSLFRQYRKYLASFYQEAVRLKHLHVLRPQEIEGRYGVDRMDCSKICIFTDSGTDLYKQLLDKYHLQMEMTAGNYVLAMTSVMDRPEGFRRLLEALREIDDRMDGESFGSSFNTLRIPETGRADVVMTAAEAEDKEWQVIPLKDSCQRVTKEYRYVYPPGVPVLVPGERITEEVIELLQYYKAAGLNVLGQEFGQDTDVISVVKENLWD